MGDAGTFYEDLTIGTAVPGFASADGTADTLLVNIDGLGLQPKGVSADGIDWLFNGWRGSDGKVYTDYVIPADVLTIAGGLTFTALWIEGEQTLTLSANGGAFATGVDNVIVATPAHRRHASGCHAGDAGRLDSRWLVALRRWLGALRRRCDDHDAHGPHDALRALEAGLHRGRLRGCQGQ